VAASNQDWARAYAKQALSDLDAREKLALAGAHKCHRLHFLQMAAEKVCKAHLTLANGHENVRRTHAYIEKNTIARLVYGNSIAQWETREIKRIAGEIQVLAPACDADGARPDNSEYPWQDGHGNVRTPCEYKFPNIDDESRTIIRLIRLIRTASESFAV